MSEINSIFENTRTFSYKCPYNTQINCVQTCAKWHLDLKIKSNEFSQNSRHDVRAVTTRNFKESFCKLLMLNNDMPNPPTFDCVKTAYGHPYLSDIENIKPTFPIDQTNINFSTLGPEFFTFFIEIDLDKDNKSEMNRLRKISNDFDSFEYEILLNANVHNTKMLVRDFYVRIDPTKVLRSIQYRLEGFKSRASEMDEENLQRRQFFVKIMDEDINMGITFSLSDDVDLATFQTNPSVLKNGRIRINKIYVEMILPMSLFFRSPSQVKEQINNLVNNYKKQHEESNSHVASLMKNNKKILNNLKNSMISPKIKNEMSQIINSELSNNPANTNCFAAKNYGSRFKPAIEHIRPKNNQNLKTDTARHNESYKKENIMPSQISFNPLGSFNKYDSTGKSNIGNLNVSPSPTFMPVKTTPSEGFSINPPNIFNHQNFMMPPPQRVPYSINYNQNQYNNYGNNNNFKPPVYVDTELFLKKLKDNYRSFGNEKHSIKTGFSRQSFNKKDRNSNNVSNFQIFMTTSTPLNLEAEDTPLRSFFTPFEKASILGLDCILKYSGTQIMTNYEPSLSSLHIELSNNYFLNHSNFSTKSTKINEISQTCQSNNKSDISSQGNSINTTPQHGHKAVNINNLPSEFNLTKPADHSTSFFSNSSLSVDNISVVSSEEHTKEVEKQKLFSFLKKFPCVSFAEDQPLHNRPNFCDKIEEIYTIYPEYEHLTLNDITDNSYFSVLWTPIKSTHNFVNNTSFLIFYRFRNKYLSNSVKYVPVIGLLTQKLDEEFWLVNTNLNYNPKQLTDLAFSRMVEDFSKNKYRYSQVIDFCHKFVANNKITNNIDYNYFHKY